MRERDLERATQLFAQIKSLEDDYKTHDAFGRHLHVVIEIIDSVKVTSNVNDWAEASKALDLNHDELHMRTNLLIRAMLDEKMANVKAELRKLGVKLEDEVPSAPAPKKTRQKLLPAPGDGK